jgi:hypothetical protein
MVLGRLLKVGSLTALGQILGLVAGLWLLRVDASGLGTAYVVLTSILLVTQVTIGGFVAADMMWLASGSACRDEEIRLVLHGCLVVSVAAGVAGAVYAFASHGSFPLSLAVLAGALLNTSIEAVHYGAGRPGRGALLSFGKATVVPIVFLVAWAMGKTSAVACSLCLLAFGAFAIAARADVDATLAPTSRPPATRAAISRALLAGARGFGTAANSLQRSAPLAIATPFASAALVQVLYVFYATYGLLYGGFRLLSQVIFREFGDPRLARRVGLLLGSAWLAALLALGLFSVVALSRPDWLLPVGAAFIATLPAALFMGFHARMTLYGRFRAYTVVNLGALALVVLTAVVTLRSSAQVAALIGAAALAELVCGVTYMQQTLRLPPPGRSRA